MHRISCEWIHRLIFPEYTTFITFGLFCAKETSYNDAILSLYCWIQLIQYNKFNTINSIQYFQDISWTHGHFGADTRKLFSLSPSLCRPPYFHTRAHFQNCTFSFFHKSLFSILNSSSLVSKLRSLSRALLSIYKNEIRSLCILSQEPILKTRFLARTFLLVLREKKQPHNICCFSSRYWETLLCRYREMILCA